MSRDLMDEDGENRAVRAFLLGLEVGCKTVGQMVRHMEMSRFAHWPSFVETVNPEAHLTKAGKQLWLRHLFNLENEGPVERPDERLRFVQRVLESDAPRADREAAAQMVRDMRRGQPAEWVGLDEGEVEYLRPPAKPPVYATAENTEAVRLGFEMGGYEKEPGYYSEEQLDEFARAIDAKLREKNGFWK